MKSNKTKQNETMEYGHQNVKLNSIVATAENGVKREAVSTTIYYRQLGTGD